MSRTASSGSVKNRPSPLSSKSFARYEPPSPGRTRASTVASPVSLKSPKKDQGREDVFEKQEETEDEALSPAIGKTNSLPDKFDELPIELASLTDRFVESLSAKIYNEPPTADQLSELFQEFYIRASGSVSTHIATLMSRLNRDLATGKKPQPLASKKSADSLAPPKGGAQQMLTASEVTEKRKARRLLEYKRILLEEAVERRACEKVYEKIWRHKSSLDEVRDEKLRSKTAALALVGIGLRDLGVEMDDKSTCSIEDLQESLAPAREGLARMNEEQYPLGKLQHLTTAHKAIVDALSTIMPSSSSADEILPTLIYTLISSPLEGINIISNLNFIQRFRTASKIDGEAAYCMTNLEAAISFLENVDLASLRADEQPEGPKKTSSSQAGTPQDELPEPFPKMALTMPSPTDPLTSTTTSSATGTPADPATSKPSVTLAKALPPPRHQRTLSDLLQPISNAPTAVRSTAEESIKTISSTLDNSFKVLFGKLRERSVDSPTAEVIVPKTLDEARELVSRPLTPTEDDTAISETSSIAGDSISGASNAKLSSTEEKVLGLFGGRRRGASIIRDRSADSQRSNASSNTPSLSNSANRKVAFAATGSSTELPTTGGAATPQDKSKSSANQTPVAATNNNTNPLDSVKNFGSSINPLNNISSAFGGAFRSFGRQNTPPPGSLPSPRSTQLARTTSSEKSLPPPDPSAEEASLRAPTLDETAQIRAEPPRQKFMALEDAAELRVGEIQELLRDYQRLGRVLENLRIIGEEEQEAAVAAAAASGDGGGSTGTGSGTEANS
ncbi:uncharacterized protein HMPREF1541_02141 [Cyphellophora europaea CBS 101466]|uniref:VPS9 domain-containing protein n=1 Tax=Cyphellophora europaea (strain CBS 101466) TaxID=1220924 RepID=W2S4L0_CYPE1|nr:uncharacterized protein HMPREF1541_02141 [Cyphellophora europaea CBS 101466]ETN42983.1 hypothetical protein HMPREF1541_02141 [Cyphellophora europaea CBS 101466]